MVETSPSQRISASQARRIALAAQGFGRPRPGSVGIRQLDATLRRLGVLQLDSVNVFERSHYLPLFARLGAYDKSDLDRLTFGRNARYTEYWAHVAALIPFETWPLWRWKMDDYKEKWQSDPTSWVSTHTDFLGWLRSELAEKGPLSASRVEHDTAGKRRGGWWEWSDVKLGLEYLFYMGEVVTAGRTRFERTYNLTEHAIPAQLRNEEIDRDSAFRTLLLTAAEAHGIGTVGDLADYFRLPKTPAAAILRDLAAEGALIPVAVDGWTRGGRPLIAYLHPEARIPRRIDTTALLSPFDPVVWERDRALRMYDFHYRIEIYTPAPKRIYGYYTLPVLVDDRIVARIDLKSDRRARVLRVQSAWHEDGQPRGYEGRVAGLLRETAAWQGLDGVEVRGWGDLAGAMATELGVPLLPRVADIEPAADADADASSMNGL
ncbi:MAG TPA: crosslink repair DNA glycosylase YcaQ family protein [Galbitalea sp.]|nr:crosslink repair DNA glycosylase YcaQ family protein [Galbitalea sp.]